MPPWRCRNVRETVSSSVRGGLSNLSRWLEEKFQTVCHPGRRRIFHPGENATRFSSTLRGAYPWDTAFDYRWRVDVSLAGWSFSPRPSSYREIKGGWFHPAERKTLLITTLQRRSLPFLARNVEHVCFALRACDDFFNFSCRDRHPVRTCTRVSFHLSLWKSCGNAMGFLINFPSLSLVFHFSE